jgi:anaerobic selenocysteine-containing dehydrogenase
LATELTYSRAVAELRKTMCNRDCPDVCSIVATVEDGKVIRLQGDKTHPITQGFLCRRTNEYLDLQYSPQRLTSPLLRKDGELVPVSWDEALDFIAERLLAIRAESGPAAIFHFRSAGAMGFVKHVTSYFFEQFGPVTDKRGDICSGAGEAAQIADFGDFEAADPSDLANAKRIIVWGRNVYVSWTHSLPLLHAAKKRGAAIVGVDPIHNRTAELCDRFYQPRPGGDFALAMATARVLFDRGWTHPDAARWCENVDAFRALAEQQTAAAWCADADLPVEAAIDLAEQLHDGPTTIVVGWGMGRRLNGAGIVRALDALGVITGNIGIPGGGVAFEAKRRRAFDLSFIQGNAPRTICEPQVGQGILEATDPPIRAVWITAGNPVAMMPESDKTAHALRTRELVVVVDPFFTDTAACATVVLPTTTLLEDDDVLGSYGHHYVGVSRPVVPAPSFARSDLEIIQALAARTGLADKVAGDARTWKRRVLGRLAERGITLERLEQDGPMKHPFASERPWADRKFATSSGKATLMREAAAPSAIPTAEFPLYLMSLSTDAQQASQAAHPPDGPLECTVHPAVTALPDGALARLESVIGSIEVRVRHDPRQRRDVALVPKGGRHREGRCANALIRARLSDHGEGAALGDELVRLVPSELSTQMQ